MLHNFMSKPNSEEAQKIRGLTAQLDQRKLYAEKELKKEHKPFLKLSEKEKIEILLKEITYLDWVVNLEKRAAWYIGTNDQLELLQKMEEHFKQVIVETKRSTVKASKKPIIILSDFLYEQLERIYVIPRKEEQYLIKAGDTTYTYFTLKGIIDRYYRRSTEEYLLLFDQNQPPTSLDLAIILNDIEMVENVLQKNPGLLRIPPENEWNALTYALAFRSSVEIIRLIFDKAPELMETVSFPKNKLYGFSINNDAIYPSLYNDDDPYPLDECFATYGLVTKQLHPMIYFTLAKAKTVGFLNRNWDENSYSEIVSLLVQAYPASLKVLRDFHLSNDSSFFDEDCSWIKKYSPLTIAVSCRVPLPVIQILADHTSEEAFPLKTRKLFWETLEATDPNFLKEGSTKLDIFLKQYPDLEMNVREEISSYVLSKFDMIWTQQEKVSIFKKLISERYSTNFLLAFLPRIQFEKGSEEFFEVLFLALKYHVQLTAFKLLIQINPEAIFKTGGSERIYGSYDSDDDSHSFITKPPASLLGKALEHKAYDIALWLIQQFPAIAEVCDAKGQLACRYLLDKSRLPDDFPPDLKEQLTLIRTKTLLGSLSLLSEHQGTPSANTLNSSNFYHGGPS